MSDVYSLPNRKARICRLAGAAFLVVAGCLAVGVAAVLFLPELARLCDGTTCELTTGPLELLPTDVRRVVTASPAARAAFDAYVARTPVRLGMAGAAFVEEAPFALLLLSVGLALRRFGSGAADALSQALPWLRRASIMAFVWALAPSVSSSLVAMLLYPGTPEGPHWFFTLDVGSIGTALMLAIAAYATVWALEAGLKAQRDLADFI